MGQAVTTEQGNGREARHGLVVVGGKNPDEKPEMMKYGARNYYPERAIIQSEKIQRNPKNRNSLFMKGIRAGVSGKVFSRSSISLNVFESSSDSVSTIPS